MISLRNREFVRPWRLTGGSSITEKCLERIKFIFHFPRFLGILAVIFMIDGIILGLGLADFYAGLEGIPFPVWFDITQEFSFGEIWEYCLTGAAAVFLLWKFRKFREPILATLGWVFAWLTLDNMLALHEQSGQLLAPLFSFASATSARAQDFGEIATFLLVGGVILAAVIFSIPRSSENANIQSFAVVILLACGAGFGVVVDFAHQFFQNVSPLVRGILSLVEDGGELVLISTSAALAISFDMSTAPEQPI